jgi:hypothetical protein
MVILWLVVDVDVVILWLVDVEHVVVVGIL